MWAGEGGKGGATALRTKRPEWAASAEPSARTVPRRVQSFMQGHQLEQAAQGGPVDYRGAIEPLRARNSAEARTCRAMPRHSAVERSRIAFSIKMFWETAPVKAVNSASSWRIAHAGGGSSAVRFMGHGDKAARARTCTALLVPLQRIFGFGGHSSPPGCSGNRRGRERVCHAHVQHHWPPREVQEEVTALGVALGARREPWRTGGAAGVGGGCSTGACGGFGAGGAAMAGIAVAPAALGAAAALATAGAAAAEASPGAIAAECSAAAASPGVCDAAVAEGTGG